MHELKTIAGFRGAAKPAERGRSWMARILPRTERGLIRGKLGRFQHPVPVKTAGMVCARIFKSHHRLQFSTYWRSRLT
jgi:hypothetical protein